MSDDSARIADLFASAGLTDAEVAELSGVSRVTVSRIKNAKGGSSANAASVRAVLITYIDERRHSIRKKVGLQKDGFERPSAGNSSLSGSDLTDLVSERAAALLDAVSKLRNHVYATPGTLSVASLADAEAAIDESYDKFTRIMGKISP